MALTNNETKLPQLTINNFPTLAAYEAAYAQGLIGTNDLSFVDEEVQVDWNQTISTASDYIKNKPTIGSGVLTIQANGTTVGTFSANDSNDKLVNIDTATAIGSMTDVVISTIGDGEILKYNATSGKWVNSPDAGGANIIMRTWSNTQA